MNSSVIYLTWRKSVAAVIALCFGVDVCAFPLRPAVAELIHHIAESGLVMSGELTRDDGDFQRQTYPAFLAEHAGGMKRPLEKAALVDLLERTHQEGERKFRDAGESLLMQPIRQFNGEPARRLTWMHHGIGHEEYHRGQIALAARVLGHVPALTRLIRGES